MGALEQKQTGDEKSDRNEIVHNMNRFCGNISTSLQQAYGNVTLEVPEIPADMDTAEVVTNTELMNKLDEAVVSKLTKSRNLPIAAPGLGFEILCIIINKFYFF
jgi:hypothetical protein